MNSIIMNFDDNTDINAVYNQLRRKYPKVQINMAREFSETPQPMEIELKKLGINSEEEFMEWMNVVIKETRRERRGENSI